MKNMKIYFYIYENIYIKTKHIFGYWQEIIDIVLCLDVWFGRMCLLGVTHCAQTCTCLIRNFVQV
jgi:hypothetical protein